MSSARAEAVYRRTYSRPVEGGFEQWPDTIDRVVRHQRWLWQRALGDVPLTEGQQQELEELRALLLARKASVSGRTLWLGGTPVSKRREASMFNCAFTKVETVHDVVDCFWLLLQGCGVGFEPVAGTLNGFTRQMDVELVRSQRHLLEQTRGRESNLESYTSEEGRCVWTISIGDSAEAWAKAVGKLLAGKRKADVLRLDFTQIRPAGERLKGYGWISSGDETFAPALEKIAGVLNRRSGQLLTRMDILDILNLLGTTLSSRRSAEIALVPYGDPEWREFALAKKDFWLHDNAHRQQSNNSLLFSQRPTQEQLTEIFDIMQQAGGSEPGFVNAGAAKKRAPWFSGGNPCVPGDTPILTDVGYVPIKDRVGKLTRIWDGESFVEVTPFSTGVNPLLRVKLSDGTSLDCTPYHQWILAGGVRVLAEELKVGDRLEKFAMPVVEAGVDPEIDAYSQGFYSGDGSAGYNFSWIYEPKYEVIPWLSGTTSGYDAARKRCRWTHGPMLSKAFVPVNATSKYCLEWLSGVFDADGTVTRDLHGNGIQIVSVDREFLQNMRLMLTRLGVRAKVVGANCAGNRQMPDGKGGSAAYYCQETWRLLIGNTDTQHLVQLGLMCQRLKIHDGSPQRDARRFVVVESVESLDAEVETFCFTNPLTNRGTFNGIVTGQCMEIMLPNKGFCVEKSTPLITKNGLVAIGDVAGQEVEIFNGTEWTTVKPFKTGDADRLWRVSFGDGSYLDVTANHRFFVADRFSKTYTEMRTHELAKYSGYTLHTEPFTMTKEGGKSVDHAYTLGFYVGDGSGNCIDIYNAKKLALPLEGTLTPRATPAIAALVDLPFDWKWATTLKDGLTEVFTWNEDSILDFVSGLADADGSNAAKGIRIYQANETFCRQLQLLLTSVGVKSSVNFMAAEGEVTNLGQRVHAVWYVQITDTSKLRCKRLKVGNAKISNKGKRQTIRSVEELPGLHETYCFNEPKTTKGVFNNSLTGQCNLVEVNLSAFNGDWEGLLRALEILARANYRQTCVNLRDGILQSAWHENNEFLRLCGVGVTGVVGWEHRDSNRHWQGLQGRAVIAAISMADELGLPRPKAVTTIKPSGTLSKVMDTTEGIHKPMGKYIFNNVRFGKHDPMVKQLRKASYRVFNDPTSSDAVLCTFPVAYEGVQFNEVNGVEVNLESAVEQLERYKRVMENYVDHNCSITVSYDLDEVPAIIDWLLENWDTYVGVSFIYRNDPTKTAQDLGYLYLPQEVVTKERYEEYVKGLLPLTFGPEKAKEVNHDWEIDTGSECATGACPIR